MRMARRSALAELGYLNPGNQLASRAYSTAHGGERQYELLMAQRHKRIAEAAYFKAEHRGFVPGLEQHDWLEAEKEIDNASRPIS